MASLVLVRHGQASLFGPDYDVLSPLGARQARALGERWPGFEGAVDHVFSGPLRRHRQTEAAFREATTGQLPAPRVIDGFREMDATAVFSEALTKVVPTCPGMLEQLKGGSLDDEARAAFRRLEVEVAATLKAWSLGEREVSGLESFRDFRERVLGALEEALDHLGTKGRGIVFTSGGPISVMVMHVFGLTPPQSVDVMQSLFNASVTELIHREGRLSLARFNDSGALSSDLRTRV